MILRANSDGKRTWTKKSCLKSTKATITLIDTDDDDIAEKADIYVFAYGKKGYVEMVGENTVNLVETIVNYDD